MREPLWCVTVTVLLVVSACTRCDCKTAIVSVLNVEFGDVGEAVLFGKFVPKA